METLILLFGLVVALMFIRRYATRKAKPARRPGGGVLAGLRSVKASRVSFCGTLMAVNLLGFTGLTTALIVSLHGNIYLRFLGLHGGVLFFNWLGTKIVDAYEARGGSRANSIMIGLFGAVWLLGSYWYFGDIREILAERFR